MTTTALLTLIERDLGAPCKHSGGWHFWHCPFHKDHTPSLAVKNERYFCFGCQAQGDAIQWLREYRKMDFKAAKLAVDGDYNLPAVERPAIQEVKPRDVGEYQEAWKQIVAKCSADLWSVQGQKALDWLHKRGLRDDTLRYWKIGYSAGSREVERGIVIPCFDGKTIQYIKVRRPEGLPKYRMLKGGHAYLYGADQIGGCDVIFLVEGEFDAMLLEQEAGDLVAVVTFGSASINPEAISAFYWKMLPAVNIFTVLDNDAAGQEAAQKWGALSPRVKNMTLPEGAKDITDFWKTGASLDEWVMQTLRMYAPGALLPIDSTISERRSNGLS